MANLLRLGVLVVLSCCSPEMAAQDLPASRPFGGGTRTINGSVVLRGTIVSNVRVTIASAGRTFQRTVYADGSGSFGLSGVPVGQYTFELEAEGYLTQRESVDVLPGSGVFLVQFMMRPAPPAKTPSSKEPVVSVATLHVPRDAQNEFAAGQRDVERKRWKEAKQHFEKALKKHADFPQALRALALLDLLAQEPERALERLRRAVEIDASYGEAHLAVSHVLNSLGRHTESLDAARKAVALRPDLWQAQYELGVAALSLGQDAVALEASERIESAAGPNVPEARLLRAGFWLKRLRYAEARAELVAFLELAPDHSLAPLAKKTLQEVEEKLSTPGKH